MTATLRDIVSDPEQRPDIANDAVVEAAAALRSRSGIKAVAAQFGFDAINRIRPGFLARQVEELLPAMAEAVEPWWVEGRAQGDAPAWLTSHADEVAEALLGVTDDHVASAHDQAAVAVYRRLRSVAPRRIAAEMPRVAAFIARWTGE